MVRELIVFIKQWKTIARIMIKRIKENCHICGITHYVEVEIFSAGQEKRLKEIAERDLKNSIKNCECRKKLSPLA